ncbi:unnamed protein product [Gadus morhua 'NCC']
MGAKQGPPLSKLCHGKRGPLITALWRHPLPMIILLARRGTDPAHSPHKTDGDGTPGRFIPPRHKNVQPQPLPREHKQPYTALNGLIESGAGDH